MYDASKHRSAGKEDSDSAEITLKNILNLILVHSNKPSRFCMHSPFLSLLQLVRDVHVVLVVEQDVYPDSLVVHIIAWSGSGNGYMSISTGNSSVTGYGNFYNAAGTRMGYIGNVSSGGYLPLQSESTCLGYSMNGTLTFGTQVKDYTIDMYGGVMVLVLMLVHYVIILQHIIKLIVVQ